MQHESLSAGDSQDLPWLLGKQRFFRESEKVEKQMEYSLQSYFESVRPNVRVELDES